MVFRSATESACVSLLLVAACGTTPVSPAGFGNGDAGVHIGGGDAGGGGKPDSGVVITPGGGDAGSNSSPDAGGTSEVAVIYAHSATELYKLDPGTNQVAVVGTFSGGCSSVIDLALDANSNAYVTTSSAFYSLNTTNAVCTQIAKGSYPNSLSFVPKGTISPTAETLVGYKGSTYLTIDITTGAMTNIGTLTKGYSSSGDIVSVIGGGTFLTVTGNGCSDCLLQVNPTTGDIVQNYGAVGHANVFGLAYWAATLYGFDSAGELFSISFPNGTLATSTIPVPSAPAGLKFWGAGSTTSAPVASPDGGVVPIQPP